MAWWWRSAEQRSDVAPADGVPVQYWSRERTGRATGQRESAVTTQPYPCSCAGNSTAAAASSPDCCLPRGLSRPMLCTCGRGQNRTPRGGHVIEVCLKDLLDRRGMSQRELARRADRHHDVVSRFARGDTSGISFDLLASLCSVLDCQPGALLRYTPDPEEQIPLFERTRELGSMTNGEITAVARDTRGAPHE